MDYTIYFSQWNDERECYTDVADHTFTEVHADIAWWYFVRILAENHSLALGHCVMDNIRHTYDMTGQAYCNGVTIKRN